LSPLSPFVLQNIGKAVGKAVRTANLENYTRMDKRFAEIDKARRKDHPLSCTPSTVKRIVKENMHQQDLDNIQDLAYRLPKLNTDWNASLSEVQGAT
jgi:hypothetical protein